MSYIQSIFLLSVISWNNAICSVFFFSKNGKTDLSSTIIWAATWENRILAYAKTKTQISFAVTAKLISAFVFATWIVHSLFFLNPKFQACSNLLWLYSPVCVGPGRKPKDRFSDVAAHIVWLHSFSSKGLTTPSSQVLIVSPDCLSILNQRVTIFSNNAPLDEHNWGSPGVSILATQTKSCFSP